MSKIEKCLNHGCPGHPQPVVGHHSFLRQLAEVKVIASDHRDALQAQTEAHQIDLPREGASGIEEEEIAVNGNEHVHEFAFSIFPVAAGVKDVAEDCASLAVAV